MQNPYTQVQFIKSAAHAEQLPSDHGREVAFAGRSNAGKSSALNALTNVRQLARVSKTPGRTQLLNAFNVMGDDDKRLIDLPGYGYAKVAQSLKQEWQKNLSHYLNTRQSLCGLVLLMDCRHPLKDLDKMMIEWAINERLPVHILLTKADKISRGQMQTTLLHVKQCYSDYTDLVTLQAFSALKKTGIDTLVMKLNQWLFDN